MAEHLQAQHSAIKMLHNRIALILQYIQAVEKGSLPDLNYYLFIYIYLFITHLFYSPSFYELLFTEVRCFEIKVLLRLSALL